MLRCPLSGTLAPFSDPTKWPENGASTDYTHARAHLLPAFQVEGCITRVSASRTRCTWRLRFFDKAKSYGNGMARAMPVTPLPRAGATAFWEGRPRARFSRKKACPPRGYRAFRRIYIRASRMWARFPAQAHGTTTSCPILRGSLRRIGGGNVQHLQEANEKLGAAMAAPTAPLAPALFLGF